MKKMIIFCLMIYPLNLFAQSDFRGITWNTSYDEVLKNETAKIIEETDNTLKYEVEIADEYFYLTYFFNEDKEFVTSSYSFFTKESVNSKYLRIKTTYLKILNLLEAKYGAYYLPTIDSDPFHFYNAENPDYINNFIDSYLEDEEEYISDLYRIERKKFIDMEIKNNYLYVILWKTDNTTIVLNSTQEGLWIRYYPNIIYEKLNIYAKSVLDEKMEKTIEQL